MAQLVIFVNQIGLTSTDNGFNFKRVLISNTFNGTAGYFFFNQIGLTSKGNGFNFKRVLISRTAESVA